jgi:hypothetical protein
LWGQDSNPHVPLALSILCLPFNLLCDQELNLSTVSVGVFDLLIIVGFCQWEAWQETGGRAGRKHLSSLSTTTDLSVSGKPLQPSGLESPLYLLVSLNPPHDLFP